MQPVEYGKALRTERPLSGPSQMSVGERLPPVRVTGPVRRFIFQGRKRTGGWVGIGSNRRQGYRGGAPDTRVQASSAWPGRSLLMKAPCHYCGR